MTTYWKLHLSRITPVQAELVGTNLLVNGKLVSRYTAYQSFFPSWEAAHAALLREAEGGVRASQADLADSEAYLQRVRAMTPDKES